MALYSRKRGLVSSCDSVNRVYWEVLNFAAYRLTISSVIIIIQHFLFAKKKPWYMQLSLVVSSSCQPMSWIFFHLLMSPISVSACVARALSSGFLCFSLYSVVFCMVLCFRLLPFLLSPFSGPWQPDCWVPTPPPCAPFCIYLPPVVKPQYWLLIYQCFPKRCPFSLCTILPNVDDILGKMSC